MSPRPHFHEPLMASNLIAMASTLVAMEKPLVCRLSTEVTHVAVLRSRVLRS